MLWQVSFRKTEHAKRIQRKINHLNNKKWDFTYVVMERKGAALFIKSNRRPWTVLEVTPIELKPIKEV